ncbi:unnamed protein product, partial [Amoebophrya sp. A25]
GFDRFANLLGKNPRTLEKEIYLVAWGCNEKSIDIHQQLHQHFDRFFPRWGLPRFEEDAILQRLMEMLCGSCDLAVKELKGNIAHKEGRIVIQTLDEPGAGKLRNSLHRLFKRIALPVWTRWLTFANCCGQLCLLLVMGLCGLLQIIHAPKKQIAPSQLPKPYLNTEETEENAAFLTLVLYFIKVINVPGDKFNTRLIGNECQSLARMQELFERDYREIIGLLEDEDRVLTDCKLLFPKRSNFSAAKTRLVNR